MLVCRTVWLAAKDSFGQLSPVTNIPACKKSIQVRSPLVQPLEAASRAWHCLLPARLALFISPCKSVCLQYVNMQ